MTNDEYHYYFTNVNFALDEADFEWRAAAADLEPSTADNKNGSSLFPLAEALTAIGKLFLIFALGMLLLFWCF